MLCFWFADDGRVVFDELGFEFGFFLENEFVRLREMSDSEANEGKSGSLMLVSCQLSLMAFILLLTCACTCSKRLSSPRDGTRERVRKVCSEDSEAERRKLRWLLPLLTLDMGLRVFSGCPRVVLPVAGRIGTN